MPPTHDGDGPQRYMLTTDAEIIRTRCSHCARKLKVRAVHEGKFVRCPKCKQRTQVVRATDGGGDDEFSVEPGVTGAKRNILIGVLIVVIVLAAIAGVWLGQKWFG